ncbi:alkane 1-monooxygenase [Flagellimonas allohymeniacidonis]|uniref:Alkane 1-monooxygenase n=1 Tax=Flagellimonas allohymeniacidonis TaxID=2517819 RepID=A0A4Q8QG54_9FLAO|nr:alkane 1-monooxygenase [Allomuricauda hymeniacidonis]TAI47563.1 alkane 1-monooxygenase [Allomuricauda hymeniacidonis]
MRDLKYLAAMTIPLSAALSILLLDYWSFFTPFYAFVIIPVMELLLPQDASNLSEEERETKTKSKFFDWMLYFNVPIVFGFLFFTLWKVSNTELYLHEIIGLVFSIGIVLGVNGINVGHELGHRQQTPERFLGKLLLLPSLYMHFYIEHNFGHHANAATKEDPATARYNQSVYSFWFTSVFRQYFSAWKIQSKLLKADGLSFFTIKNDMLWYTLFQVAYLALVYFLFGFIGLWFALGAGVIGFLLLETVNYIEHYGLMRKKLSSGRYERVRESHSWNSNHVIGRIVLYELTRHSDHHYKSAKKYQLLDYHDISPQMPYGYPTSMVLSFVPPLWFHIMNQRIPKEMKPDQDSLSLA